MKRVILVGLVSLVVTGCSSDNTDSNTNSVNGVRRWSYIQELPDGRTVVCAAAVEALSCDWDNAR